MNDYVPQIKKRYRYVLVVVDKFSEFGWTIALKNKNPQSKTDSFSEIVETSKCKPKLLESDDSKE